MFRPSTKPAADQLHVPPVEQLLVEPDCRKPGSFTGRLQRTAEIVVRGTRQPLVDAARELLRRGHDPAALLTMRHVSQTHDSVAPLQVSHWAKVTFTEGETTPLRRQAWKPRQMPIAAVTGAQKSGFATGREEGDTR
jgi:hypothetical protein